MQRHTYSAVSLLLWSWVSLVCGIPTCPFPGAAFTKPANLAASPTIQTALKNLTAAFETYDQTSSNNPNGTSWSLQVFSAYTDEPVWEHYHTANNLLDKDESGNFTIGPDTIYRLGSLTKVFTMLTFLAEAGDSYLNEPVTKYIPELELLAAKARSNPIMSVDWSSVTIGGLASHMGGLARDCN